MSALQGRRANTNQRLLFGDEPSPHMQPGDGPKQNIIDPAANSEEGDSCTLTPLSGYDTHINAIQSYAFASPANFAQTLLFSPLSANVPFPKHWDNFHMLMMILKHRYPDKVSEKELEHAVDSFGDYLHSMAHTIGGWKLKTVTYVWNNKEELMNRITSLAKEGNDAALIGELVKIPGVQAIKAGFIAQLLFGRIGCIDTHNIDIYSKAFPDLKDKLNPKQWAKKKDGVESYLDIINTLAKRGIATKQLWDVWVDFVENFYKYISNHGMGSYTDMGTAIDNPDDARYEPLRKVKIPKMGATTGGKIFDIQPVSGKAGMGASATHLQDDPDNTLKQFDKIYNKGEPGNQASRAVPFRKTKWGIPVDRNVGLGTQPSLLKYFGQALSNGEVDSDHIRHIIQQRMAQGGKKSRAQRAADNAKAQKDLWGNQEW